MCASERVNHSQVPTFVQSHIPLRLDALAFMGKVRCRDSSFMQEKGNPEISKWKKAVSPIIFLLFLSEKE